MSERLECRISLYQLRAGVLQIPRRTVSSVFPGEGVKGVEKVHIKICFDDDTNPVVLTYSPRFYLLYGLRKWHQRRNAEVGDFVIIKPSEIHSPIPIYRLRLEKKETGKV